MKCFTNGMCNMAKKLDGLLPYGVRDIYGSLFFDYTRYRNENIPKNLHLPRIYKCDNDKKYLEDYIKK